MEAGAPQTLGAALAELRDRLGEVELGLELPEVSRVRHRRSELIAQIGDYLLPRLEAMDAPLLIVVGGSTGAGKSTLVNSLIGAPVSPAGVLRPTTRAPLLVCHPADLHWFEDARILPGLPRTIGDAAAPGGLGIVPAERLLAGLALLDSPDIDSVVEANRELARQLLAAADAWLFVTTPARYADAVPWELLEAARERGTSLALVLNRLPADAGEVGEHLRAMLTERGLGGTEMLTVPEAELDRGLLPAEPLSAVRSWVERLASDAEARADIVRHTLGGALDSLIPRVGSVVDAQAEQLEATAALRADVERAYEASLAEIEDAMKSGALLRGEVLARWHELVGTGELMRAMETRIGWLRDRLRALVTGGHGADAELKIAVEASIETVVHAAADRGAERAANGWRQSPAGRALLDTAPQLESASPDLRERAAREIRDWQGFVFDLVREQGAEKRATARLASLGVNGAGLVVMLAVFVQSAGLTGAEVLIAGGTSAISQRILEAIFGDQAVRTLAARARDELLARVEILLDAEAAHFLAVLEGVAPPSEIAGELEAALARVQASR